MEKLQILLAFVVSLGAASGASLGVVQTEGGSVQGQNVAISASRSVDVFKGIPFAAQPGVFEKPQRHPGWEGTLKATKFGPRCMQIDIFQTGTFGSEDCLYLNIWVPQGQQVSSNLPVMIWFFGGGFLVGGSMGPNLFDNYMYSGQELAEMGDVIVVSVGYRVGVLGFLSTGDSGVPGNYGLWDQHAAIAWVHRNIGSFGGDPENITIFGESAGGASVSFQTLTPYNKGLVRRAIAQSGVALCPWALITNPRTHAQEVAVKVGCPTDDRMAACLRSTDPKILTMAGPHLRPGTPETPTTSYMYMSPVVDGDFIPDHPGNLFHNAADIDYLSGVNNMDGHMFTSLDLPFFSDKTKESSVEDLRTLLATFTKDKGKEGMEVVFADYSANWEATPSQESIKRTAVEIETDYAFLIPAQSTLFLHKDNARTGRTYSYVLSEQNSLAGPNNLYHEWVGADHADDLQYLFGKPFFNPGAYGDRHRNLSSYFIAYWANFARTGDPNKGNLPVPVFWPEFTYNGQEYMNLNSQMSENSVGHYMRLRYVHLWTKTLQSMPSYVADDQ
ncbi:bile salt-activated lipase-like [Salarias fasciatus]|uniref:bile salt-activated lipase-like n=1 Tax=Salarias fasciatus TaxID=181472 RepID=UPI001176C2E7|nr:bile salt-activated lipase-like [Salarias fasciatus]